jgi:hypothetical protein
MSIEFLDNYDGILPNTPRSYGRVCCICRKDGIYSYNGTSVWAKYKENGKWTGEWVCNSCKRRRKGHRFKKNKKCRLCGSDKTRNRSDGKAIWVKDLNINGDWIGEYLCYDCVYTNNRPVCGHVNRFEKIYDSNGLWTGERRCKICNSFLSNIILMENAEKSL